MSFVWTISLNRMNTNDMLKNVFFHGELEEIYMQVPPTAGV